MQPRPLPFSAGEIFAFSFWFVFACWILPEVIAWKVKRSADSSNARDQGSLHFIVTLWWAGIVMNFLLPMLLPHAAILWKRVPIFFFGIALMLLGILLRWYSASVLGKYFTFDVAIHSNHLLVETGPYRYIRHPSYSGALLSLLGFGLALGNWAGLIVSFLCLGFAYAYRIPIEEGVLVSALGKPYEEYQKRTWRLVPFLF